MSLSEIIGTPQYETYVAPKLNTPSPEYTAAVNQVRDAPSGTLISRVEQTKLVPDVTQPIATLANPLELAGTVLDLFLGTREDKAIAVGGLLPVDVVTQPAYDISMGEIPQNIVTNFGEHIGNIIEIQKENNPELKKFYETAVLYNTNVEVPDLPEIILPNIDLFGGLFGGLKDIGKWILIAGGVIIVILLLIGRKSK